MITSLYFSEKYVQKFLPGRSRIDQITTVETIIEDCLEWQNLLTVNFVDFQKAFENIVVCWLLNDPATCECISGTDLLRQFYVLPH